MKISVRGRRLKNGRNYRVIEACDVDVDGEVIGMIERIPASKPHMAHWSGEVVVNDETWRINSPTLQDVIDRVKEAYNASKI